MLQIDIMLQVTDEEILYCNISIWLFMNSNNRYVLYKFKIKWQYSAVWDKFVLWNSSCIISLLMFILARNVCDIHYYSWMHYCEIIQVDRSQNFLSYDIFGVAVSPKLTKNITIWIVNHFLWDSAPLLFID